MRRAERLFQIIQILRRTSRPVTSGALAAELEVSARTIYRDVADLVGQRVPITGEAGFGYLLGHDYDMPPLMLTPSEVEAVVLGAQWVAERGDWLLSPAACDVLAKVATVVPNHLRPFIAEPSTSTEPVLDHLKEEVKTSSLREAVRKGTKLRLVYRAESGETTTRTVWPVTLGYADTKRVLIAWCEVREGFRDFRTDRMHAAELLNEPIGLSGGELRRRWQAWRAKELVRESSS